MDYYQFRAMNTDIVLAAEGEADAITHGFYIAREYIVASEARFTRFAPDSELSRLNRAAGSWFDASEEMLALLLAARRLAEASAGLFNPAVLGALEAAGYDRSFEFVLDGEPLRPLVHGSPAVGSFRAIELDEAARRVRLPQGMRIDLGGIGKGWIAQQAARRLAGYSEACAVNAGGDLCALGRPREDGAWRVALEDPRDPAQTLAVIRSGPGAIATSSVTRRRWQREGRTQHHLIDPRTGLPAESAWLSVTAIAREAAAAEVFAKALLIAGPAEAERMAAGCAGLAFIAVDKDGNLWGSPDAKEYLENGNGSV